MSAASDAPLAFFSYSRHDSEFVLKLAKDLRQRGAAVWLDQLDIAPGEHWDSAVERALANCPRMLVVLSPSSVDSTNVMDEVSFALEERKLVIPFLYRDCKIPFRLRRVQYIDARTDYESGLHELLRMLGIVALEEAANPGPEGKASDTTAVGAAASATPPDEEQTRIAGILDEREEVQAARAREKADRERIERGRAEAAQSARPGVERADAAKAREAVERERVEGKQVPPDTATPSAHPNSRRKLLIGSAVAVAVAVVVFGIGISRLLPKQNGQPAVGPEWVKEFLEAYRGPSLEAIRPYFYDTVSPYYSEPSANWAEIEKDKKYYYSRFPTIRYTLVGEPQFRKTSQGSVVEFDVAYANVRNDGQSARGTVHWTIAVIYVAGVPKIAGIQERSASQ